MKDREAIALYTVLEAFKSLREARSTLCDVAQLIAGWKTTTPTNEWSEFDEKTYKKVLALQRRIESKPAK